MGPRSLDIQPADPEDIPGFLRLCSAPEGVINDTLAEKLYGIAVAIQETREAQDIKPYTVEDLRIVTHFAVMAATGHRGQTRHSGADYFLDHIVGSVTNLIEKLGRTRVPVIGATFNHDLAEDTGILSQHDYLRAWRQTFVDPADSLIRISDNPVARSRKLMEVVTKVRFDDRDLTDAATARKLLHGIGLFGLDALDPKLADGLHNASTLKTQKFGRRKPIAERTYGVLCRLGDITGVQAWVRECVDWCAQELNPSLRTDLTVRCRARIREVLDATKIPGRNITVRQYIDRFLDQLDGVLRVDGKPQYGVDNFELADFTLPQDAPLQALTIDSLDITSVTPLFEYKIIVTPDTDKEAIARAIISHCTTPEDPPSEEDNSEFPNRGLSFVITSEKIGVIKFRINDSVSEARAKRGVRQIQMQSALASETVPIHIKEAVPLILRATRYDVGQTLTLARKFFLRPMITVRTPKGTVIQLPAGSCATDFAAQIHTGFAARRIAQVLCHYSGKSHRVIGPYDSLEPNTRVELVWSRDPDPIPDLRSLVFATTAFARKVIRRELANKSAEALEAGGKKYAVELTKLFGISTEEMLLAISEEKERYYWDEREASANHNRRADMHGFDDEEFDDHEMPLDLVFDNNTIFRQIGSGEIELLNILSRTIFADKKTWKTRVCLPNEPGILRRFLGEFEREGMNVDRIIQIPALAPRPHIIRMQVTDPRKDASSFAFLKVLLKLGVTYPDLTVGHRLFEKRWLERLKDGWQWLKYWARKPVA